MRKSLKRWLIPMSAAMIALLSAGTALAAGHGEREGGEYAGWVYQRVLQGQK